jgi:hypothetical protein
MTKEGKSLKQYAKEGKARNLDQEVERDIECWRKSLVIPKKEGPEKESAMLLRRIALLVGGGDLHVGEGGLKDNIPIDKSAAQGELPVATYLTHGSRVIIDLPPDNEDKVYNWLTGGHVFDRVAATHGVKRSEEGLYETKTKGVVDMVDYSVRNMLNFIPFVNVKGESYHKGSNVAMYRPEDQQGSVLADGSQGHVYIYYDPPTDKKRGELLLGIEEDAPGQANHSLTGASNPVSATGGRRLEEIQEEVKERAQGDDGWELIDTDTSFEEVGDEWEKVDIISDKKTVEVKEPEQEFPEIPGKYNGMRIKFAEKNADQLTNISYKEVEVLDLDSLASARPKQSVETFLQEVGSQSRSTFYQDKEKYHKDNRKGIAKGG